MIFQSIVGLVRRTYRNGWFAAAECILLVVIASIGWRELHDMHVQHQLERRIQGKSSVQRVNALILEDDGDSQGNKENAGNKKTLFLGCSFQMKNQTRREKSPPSMRASIAWKCCS